MRNKVFIELLANTPKKLVGKTIIYLMFIGNSE